MKKLIASLTVFAFCVALAGMVYAEVDTRSPAEKLEAGRAYIKLLDQKIIKYRAQGNAVMVKKLQAEKKGTIAALQKWKVMAEAEAAKQVATGIEKKVAPPPAPVTPKPASMGMFGWGLDTSLEVGLVAGMMGITGNILLPDPMGLGPMVGLSADAIQYKIGLGYAQGNDKNSKEWKAVPLYVSGIVNLPADLLGGVESYLEGGINYVITRSGNSSGTVGGQFMAGIQGDLGMGLGKTYGAIGYSVLRTGLDKTMTNDGRTSMSFSAIVGQKVTF
ncbi:MAG: hypothetical protein ABIJ26_01555 [Candidatus Margulisiibacteriota bacterium]|nr:hypothetical protein [Candidatus Margulisiibacteriota bacterium]